MPTPTYTPLANITLGSTAATVTFSSISQSYRDLILVINGGTTAGDNAYLWFNADGTSGNYSNVIMNGSGSAVASTTAAVGAYLKVYGSTTTTIGFQAIAQIMDFSATDKHKSVIVRDNNSANSAETVSARWANTAAITSIAVKANTSTWIVGTTMDLYGIVSVL
jgi:hypothetical protein